MERERKVRAIVTAAMLVAAVLMLGVLEGAIFLRHQEEAAVSLDLRRDNFPTAVSRVPPCPAMGFDATDRSWDLWRVNFPDATQCVIGSPAVVVDVQGR